MKENIDFISRLVAFINTWILKLFSNISNFIHLITLINQCKIMLLTFENIWIESTFHITRKARLNLALNLRYILINVNIERNLSSSLYLSNYGHGHINKQIFCSIPVFSLSILFISHVKVLTVWLDYPFNVTKIASGRRCCRSISLVSRFFAVFFIPYGTRLYIASVREYLGYHLVSSGESRYS